MNIRTSDLVGKSVLATDGTVGTVSDLLFDDERWVVRYLIVRTNESESSRPVLLSPISVLDVGTSDKPVTINLSRKSIESAPDVSQAQPVSRRFEIEFSKHFEYPIYWIGGGLWGGAMNPVVFAKSTMTEEDECKALEGDSDESHLRSIDEVTGYHLWATDGSIGHVEDFLLEGETWRIAEVVIDTRNWLPGRKVVVAPRRIDEIVWAESRVSVAMSKDEVKLSPEIR